MSAYIIQKHRGIVVDFLKSPLGSITGYRIRENGIEYIAHLGDIQTTEKLLYDLRDHKKPDTLELENFNIGDDVEFEPFGLGEGIEKAAKHAFHVTHINK